MAKRFFNWWLRLAYWVVLRLKVEGRERIPVEGPVILMINHAHFLDPFVVLASMPRPVTVLSKIENFSIPFWGWIFKWYGAIPVRRGQVDRQALRGALVALKQDILLIVAESSDMEAPFCSMSFSALVSLSCVLTSAFLSAADSL